jgi:hypothetical protein
MPMANSLNSLPPHRAKTISSRIKATSPRINAT